MFCPNCGARNSEADTTCQKCGFNLKDATGAKFKGTMLMMNNAAGLASELRKSAPPAAAASTGASVPPTPEEARMMRAKLKGTMIGVAPPAVGAFRPPGAAAPTPVNPLPGGPPGAGARPLSATGPGSALPGPGQVNAPGAGLHQGGGTMIGTGFGVGPAPAPRATGKDSVPPGPTVLTHGGQGTFAPVGNKSSIGRDATQHPFSTSPTEVPVSVEPLGGPGTVRSEPEPAGHRPSVGPTVSGSEVSGLGGTRVMSQFEQQTELAAQAFGGTMLTGQAQGPDTDPIAQAQPQFAPQAGVRTGTPAMGIPEMSDTMPNATESFRPSTPLSDGPGLEKYVKPESKVMLVVLTILTGGLYLVYRKFAASKTQPKH